MHFQLLQDLVILLGFSVIIVFTLQRFNIPSILGFILTGIIIGPNGLSFVSAVNEVEIIAEIGVILLLFVIGMEISLKQLLSMSRTVFIGGFLQVGFAVASATFISKFFGVGWNQAIFIGFLFSLSSTAIVLKILQERNEISAPHGRNALGILIFQDIIVVPMMLVTPILAGQTTNVGLSVLLLLLKSGLVIVVTYFSANYLVPHLMNLIVRTKKKELFLLTIITLCFTIAFLTAEAGLSLALGAFLAGLVISESEYSHQATSVILPFRELFTSIFFISIGMLLDLDFFIANIGIVLLLSIVVFLLKGSIVFSAISFLKYPPRTALLTGLALFQIGEFAFILSKIGVEYGLFTAEMNQYFLSISIITMLFTPYVIAFSEKIVSLVISSRMQKGWGKVISNTKAVKSEGNNEIENHLVIIGYGINGRNVARAARFANIPYIILELNAETVKSEKKKGEPIIYGDATQEYILESLHINKARIVVVAISDPKATKTIISNIRNISHSVNLIIRTRYVAEINDLMALGADEVIPEEFETSIKIFILVLQNYLTPIDELKNIISSIRADNYEVFNYQNNVPTSGTLPQLHDFKISCLRVLNDSGSIVGKTIFESNIRKRFGVNILAISRNDEMITSITPDERVLQGDLVFVSGDQEQIESLYKAVT